MPISAGVHPPERSLGGVKLNRCYHEGYRSVAAPGLPLIGVVAAGIIVVSEPHHCDVAQTSVWGSSGLTLCRSEPSNRPIFAPRTPFGAGEIATNDRAPLEVLARRAGQGVEKLASARERFFHPFRRRRARRQLTTKPIRSVLFLCHGNAYRSPYAAAAFQRALAAKRRSTSIEVASAGFIAPGHHAPDLALSVARARGIDLSSHLSTLVTSQAIGAADLVAVMSEDQARGIRSRYGQRVRLVILGDLDPLSIESRAITDPLGHDARVVEQVYSRIDRCVEQIAGLIAE